MFGTIFYVGTYFVMPTHITINKIYFSNNVYEDMDAKNWTLESGLNLILCLIVTHLPANQITFNSRFNNSTEKSADSKFRQAGLTLKKKDGCFSAVEK